MDTDHIVEDVIALGALIENFALINRATQLADGTTPESDTDHTVMLGIIGCAYAAAYDPTLDTGRVAQFALVHDLVEVYAGDTNTFGGLPENQKSDKDAREARALERIEKEFNRTFPWIAETIHSYESLDSREARFVKTLDKVLPKITRLVNKKIPHSREEFKEHVATQYSQLESSYGSDQDAAMNLYKKVAEKVIELHETF